MPMKLAKVHPDEPTPFRGFNPFRRTVSHVIQPSLMVACLAFLTTCSDDSKPYMILKALDESYKNHVGFVIIRVRGRKP